ncbi:MAG: kelch repeat-containing protein, partial [bacterium]
MTNTGTATITSLTVTDTVPSAIPFWTIATEQPPGISSATRYDVPGSGTLFVWSSGSVNLPPGMSFTFTIYGTVSTVCAGASVDNVAVAMAGAACGPPSSLATNVASFSLPAVPAPSFTAVKTQTPASPAPGQSVTYRIDVTNTGLATLTDLSVTDTISPVVTGATAMTPSALVQPSVSQTLGGTLFTWSGGPLTWATMASMPTPRENLSAGVVGDKLYALGGWNGGFLSTVEAYDPTTNTWSARAAMTVARYDLAAGVVGDRLYAVGGYNGSYLSSVEAYDPMTNTWSAKAVMPTPRERLAAGVLGGRLYAVGGNNGAPLSTMEAYDSITNTWSVQAAMTTARYWPAVGVLGGQLYAVGGGNGAALSTVEAYDPATSTWSARAAMPTARMRLAACVLGDQLYAVGGSNGANLSTVESYDPATDTWTARAAMPTPRQGLAGGGLAGQLYAVGGGDGASYFSNLEAGFPGMVPGTTLSFTLTGMVGEVACGSVEVSNTAWVSAGTACQTVEANSNLTSFTAAGPSLAFTASTTLTTANPGPESDVQYRIVVTNTGTATITSLTVSDTVPSAIPSWTIATDQPAGISSATRYDVPGSGTRFEWSSGAVSLPPGMSLTFTIYGTVSTVCAGATVNNVGVATAGAACGPPASLVTNTASFVLPAVPSPSFTVVKTQTPASPAPGSPVTYRIDVTNTGSATIVDLTVVDTVSPVVTGATTMTPSAYLPPAVSQALGGTRYVWSGGPLAWTTMTPMPTARWMPAAAIVSGRFYVLGGGNAGILTANEEYDPATDTWATKASMPTARSSLAAGTVGGRLYAVGGDIGGSVVSTNEEYDPAMDAWATKAAMSTSRGYLAAGVMNGRLYAVGGYNGGSS